MLQDKDMQQLRQTLRRIFALPVTKTTFKEVQRSVFLAVNEDTEKANQVLESLITGETKPDSDTSENGVGVEFKEFIDEFNIPTRLSREIMERGEFISFMSSDLISPSNRVLFLNLIRRLDGVEFQFLTEPEGVIQLVKHFIGRLEEVQRVDRSNRFVKSQAEEFKSLRDRLDKMMV